MVLQINDVTHTNGFTHQQLYIHDWCYTWKTHMHDLHQLQAARLYKQLCKLHVGGDLTLKLTADGGAVICFTLNTCTNTTILDCLQSQLSVL